MSALERGRVPRSTAAVCACALLVVLGMPGLRAASLQVAPTSLQLSARQNAEALWVSNSGSAPVSVQARVFRWTQRDGRDQLDPTSDLVVSPPMQSLAAGQQQLIRVVRAQPEAPDAQLSYRVIVDEVPTLDPNRQGMQFVLRYSLPVFIQPDGSAAGKPAGLPARPDRLRAQRPDHALAAGYSCDAAGRGHAIGEDQWRRASHAPVPDATGSLRPACASPWLPARSRLECRAHRHGRPNCLPPAPNRGPPMM
jgi:P pilus assembly chaperone PapD